MSVRLHGVRVELDARAVLDEVDLDFAAGRLTAVVGPNGSGKTTLLRTIYGRHRPSRGRVTIGGHDVARLSAKEAARLRSVVTQHQGTAEGMTALDVVLTGRFAHSGSRPRPGDLETARTALARIGAESLAGLQFTRLSGGERQRVLLARALAQQAPVLLLDEPTNHLDPRAEHDLLALLSSLQGTRIVVLHDLDLALGHADRVVVVAGGRVVTHGPPGAALDADVVERVFGVRSTVIAHPLTGRPLLVTARLPR